MTRDIWNDRPVTFVDFTIREGKVMTEAFARDGEEGSFMLLVLSLRYAESNEPVFASIDEVYAQPFRMRERLGRLATKAAFAAGMTTIDPDAPPKTNGHAVEQPNPSH